MQQRIGLTALTVSQSHRRSSVKGREGGEGAFFPLSCCVRVSRCPGIWFRHLHCGPRRRFDSKRGAPCGPCPPRPQAAFIPAPAFSIARLLACPPCQPCVSLTLPPPQGPPGTQVVKYPGTQGLAWPFLHTANVCLFPFLALFLFIFLSCFTTVIIINPQCCKVQWMQEAGRERERE